MGNQMSVPLRPGDQEHDPEADTYKVTSDNACVQNGNSVVLSTHVIQHYEEVDLGISSPKKDNVATSSPKTMEAQAVGDASGKNLGKDAKLKTPAARSHFFLTLSRPVPGRPGDQGTDSSAASGRFDVSPSTENKDPSEHGALPVAAAPGQAPDKTPGCTEAKQQTLPATGPSAPSPPESRAEAPAQAKDFSFLNRFFKLDKGRESVPVDSQPKEDASKGSEDPEQATEAPAVPGNPHGVSAAEDIVDREERGQEVDTLSYSVPGDPEVLGTTQEDPRVVDTTENNSSIMSFFKTLVSPNKTETKKDPEDMDTENSTSANLKSDKANFTPQETQGKTKSAKSCSPPPPPPPPETTSEARDGGKEKAGPTSLPLGKLFWKKSVKEDTLSTGAEETVVCESPVETVRLEEVESGLQTVDLSEETLPGPTDVKVKEESKPRRTPLMAFLRQMSVRSSEGITRSEESNGKDPSCQTSNSVEKTPSPPEPEPAGTAQKSKETSSSKDKKSVDKKSAAENNKQKNGKQEVREPVPCVQPPTVEANAMQTGDKTPKRSEKRRQSLGGFLKGLGPKRMLDAQVQTDPVSIGPVGKSK
ncbi:breast carcinoma-amplified sequence 1 isoform X2 [Mus pahari]|uniref:breast carcinoma-amplified sequence 1 isoform X2 n=1 Tax=Mus pahari TaxID=10093 RepID=UPI000A30B231|nr:breast carcinoma-amplified sequence 1 isoform X2 [Mus pahari]